jgi:hypothetical protein
MASPSPASGLSGRKVLEDFRFIRSFRRVTHEDLKAVIAFAATSAEEDLPVSGISPLDDEKKPLWAS